MLTTIFNTYKSFLLKLIQLFFPWNRKSSEKLHVSGKGCLDFEFKTYPEDVRVRFTDEPIMFPCNPCDPGTEDTLYWKVHRSGNGYVLVIHWNVTGFRTIEWEVCE
jgi:hypothetical protein